MLRLRWTSQELGDQPTELIEAIRWGLFVDRLRGSLMTLDEASHPQISEYTSLLERARILAAAEGARQAAIELRAVLFPPDEGSG